jgi:hypothetical protein
MRVSGVFGIERRVQSVSDLDEVFRRELGWSPVVCACVIDEGLVQRDVVALDVVSEALSTRTTRRQCAAPTRR